MKQNILDRYLHLTKYILNNCPIILVLDQYLLRVHFCAIILALDQYLHLTEHILLFYIIKMAIA